ncbi:copper chaperone PCu(A)C [Rubellimicrobium rubrum]|uniref:Copper chaperone PCu(A)C n=1 Tax=Rubellimicrobium rubrum TaxID=2585369 RepID=A0A5C4N6V0_9RHOB|nr:copper chaperone PCu(A)C [Rubellimicrobium rubrum]TNC52021.1 copper chaperone PCu(A)C [Rubellimicrobium rubrum]
MRFMFRSALAALALSAAPVLAQDIGVHDAYAITAIPGAPTGSAYMLIHNHASAADRLIGASSPAADRVEIHENLEENGVIRMRHVEEGLELRPGSVLLLNRGGPHLMFLGITDSFEDGDTVPITLTFEKAGDVPVEAIVDLSRLTEDAEGDPAMDHDAMDHGTMDHDAMDHGAMDHGTTDGGGAAHGHADHQHTDGQGG